MSTLQQNIHEFMHRTDQFCKLLGMTWDEMESLKETDSPEGNNFYAVYMSYIGGIYPTQAFIKKYKFKETI